MLTISLRFVPWKMYHNVIVLLASVLVIELSPNAGVESIKIITSLSQMNTPKQGDFLVRCNTESRVPITGCQVRIWYVGKQVEGVLLNVTGGKNSTTLKVPNPYHPGTNYTAFLYGAYFNFGTCDVRLCYVNGKHILIGCKLRTETEESAVGTTAVILPYSYSYPPQLSNETLHVKLGESVDVVLAIQGIVLRNCSAKLANEDKVDNIRHDQRNQHDQNTLINEVKFQDGSPASPRYTALKTNNHGECGFTINNVTERDNGVFFVTAYDWYGQVSTKAVTLLVTSLNMTFSKRPEKLIEGDKVTVTCTARGVRHADIRWSWWLDGTNITDRAKEQRQTQPVDGWSWPWEVEASQSVTLTLTSQHHGKNLTCWIENLEDSKNDLGIGMTFQVQRRQAVAPTSTTSTTMSTTSRAANVSPKGRSSSKPTKPSRSSSSIAPTDNRAMSPTEPHAANPTTETKQGSDMSTNILVIIGAVTAALLVVVIITALLLVAFVKKLACFKVRDTELLVQYNGNSPEGQDQSNVIISPSTQSKSPKPKPLTVKNPTQAKPTPKPRAEPKNAGPKKPKPCPEEGQPLKPAPAQSGSAAGSEFVQYAELVNVKMTPKTPKEPCPEEVKYAQLHWDK